MIVRFVAEMKKMAKGQSRELYDKIEKYGVNLIDLGDLVYITGKVPFQQLSAVLYECLSFGVVECEVGEERRKGCPA